MASKFTPAIVDHEHVTMLVRYMVCPICEKCMVAKPTRNSPFSTHVDNSFFAQLRRANLEIMSNVRCGDELICETCMLNDKATFFCAFCKEHKKSSLVQFQYGDDTEYLCTDCYSTVPARVWDAMVKEIQDRHRYDFL